MSPSQDVFAFAPRGAKGEARGTTTPSAELARVFHHEMGHVLALRRQGVPASAPLFLVNHWITTDPLPKPSNAAKVNAYAPLLHRLEECRRIRGHIPNLVAVDFYRRGDLMRAVDTINQVSGS